MKRIALCSGLALSLFFVFAVLEIVEPEAPVTAGSLAMELFEPAMLALAVAAVAFFAIGARELRRERSDLLVDLSLSRADGDSWKKAALVHIDGLRMEIQAQCENWHLTRSETDIAFLILKGLSHKEIARIRASAEATVRQQARSIYEKSGLTGRAELAAFFLEDMFLPDRMRGPCPPPAGSLTIGGG